MTSPKARLLQNVARARSIDEHLANPLTEEAIHVAWGQYCFDLSTDTPAANDSKRLGARQFIDVLLSIAKEQGALPKSRFPQLIP